MADTSVSYKCLCCGAPLSFRPGAEKVTCEYCGTELEVKTVEEFYAQKEIPVIKKTKTGYSTDVKVLEALQRAMNGSSRKQSS